MNPQNSIKQAHSQVTNSTSQTNKIQQNKDDISGTVFEIVSVENPYEKNSSVNFDEITVNFYSNGKKIKIEFYKTQESGKTCIEIPLMKINPQREKISDYFFMESLKNGFFILHDKRFKQYYYFYTKENQKIAQIIVPQMMQNIKNTKIFDGDPIVDFDSNLYFYFPESGEVKILDRDKKKIIPYNDFFLVIGNNNSISIFYNGIIYKKKLGYFLQFDSENVSIQTPLDKLFNKSIGITNFESIKNYLRT